MSHPSKWGALLLAALIFGAAGNLGSGLWILAKAELAQWLLAGAWARTLAGEETVRPWPWAATWPVARIVFERSGEQAIVLAGATGSSLAFGPGQLAGSPLPGRGGNSVIAGHRDTHFASLADIAPGDVIQVQVPGRSLRYRVTWLAVVDERDTEVIAPTAEETLTLVTCWPFDAVVPGGPLRLVVRARAEGLAEFDQGIAAGEGASGNPPKTGSAQK